MGRPAITVKPRYPFAPLEALLRVQLRPELNGAGQERGFPGRMAEALGVDRRQVIRWQQYGLSAEQADRLAVALGRVPWEIWQEWADAAQRRREMAAARMRKSRQKPEVRERDRARSAAYRAECSHAVDIYRRDYYAKNRERLLQAQRVRDGQKRALKVISTENEDNARNYPAECIDYKDVTGKKDDIYCGIVWRTLDEIQRRTTDKATNPVPRFLEHESYA